MRFVIAILLLFLSSCSSGDETAHIRNIIEKGASFAESHDIKSLFKLATNDIVAMPGPHDARSIKKILFWAFNHYGNFEIHYPRPLITFNDGKKAASATIFFMLVRKDHKIPGIKELYDDPEKWLKRVSEKADLYQLELDFVKKAGQWKVKAAQLARYLK